MLGRRPQSNLRSARVIGLLVTIPLILAAAPMIGFAAGYLLDGWLGTGQVLRIVLLGVGFAAGVREMLGLLRKAREDFERL